MRKLIFFLLLLFALYQKESKAAENPAFSFDTQKRISSCRRKDGSLLFYSYDALDRIVYVNSSDESCEYEFIYEGSALEPALVYNKNANASWPSPFPETLFTQEKLPFYVALQIEATKLILKGTAQFVKVSTFLEDLGKKIPVPVLNDLFLASAELLKLAYNPIEDKPYVYLLKTQGEKNTPIRLGYLNGMMNIDEGESLYSGDLILEKTKENLNIFAI